MARIALAACLAFVAAGCAAAPQKATAVQPLTQACAEIAKQLENGGSLQQLEKKELVEKLKDEVFHWKIRILAVSDETSKSELVGGMAFDVECQDRPSNTEEHGMRYTFTLYFDKRVPELAALTRGDLVTVDGTLTSYEGQGAFAAHVKAYAIEGK
ncbi:MAG TPA: hypothetical protein VGK67_32200 [Myxococcales bacterium]